MPTLKFEELLPQFGISGTFSVNEVPNTGHSAIIRTNQSWNVDVEWTQTGALCWLMSGRYKLKVLLEKMGIGETNLSGSEANVNFVSSDPHTYNQSISIPANAVTDGLYRVVVVITMEGPSGTPGPIAAYGDAGLIQFYKVGQ